ncbi:MAG: peptide chain release factor N(5)-glutamine methyltransferase [Moraxella sp.]|nr:MAG: peptide chain release factor N(5)-glutamine methyltransferase [Moraxella sp.]
MKYDASKSISQIKKDFFKSIDAIPQFIIEDLLLWVIDKNKTFLITNPDYVLTDKQYQDFIDGIQKLKNKIPLAYITGKQAFWGREFLVNCHTLIPRPDSECMIDAVIDFVNKNFVTAPKILDLGTGTGCLAITLAKELPNSQVVAVDFSLNALELANKNAKNLSADNCVFIHSDWFDKISDLFDIIISNPPYIALNDKHLDDLVAEPITALVAKDDGLADIYHIIKHAKNYLHNQGILLIEHGFNQTKQVQDIFCQFEFGDIDTIKDYGGNDRITKGIYYE